MQNSHSLLIAIWRDTIMKIQTINVKKKLLHIDKNTNVAAKYIF